MKNKKNLRNLIIVVQFILILTISCSNRNQNNDKIENIIVYNDNMTNSNTHVVVDDINIIDIINIENNEQLLSEGEIVFGKFFENYFWSLDIVNEADYNWRFGLFIRFDYPKNNEYVIIPNGSPFDPWVYGNYHIEEENIILTPTRIDSYGREIIDEIFKEKLELERIIIDNSLFFIEGLIGKGIIFGAGLRIFGPNDNDKEFRPKKGDIRYVNGHKLIIDDYRESKLISDAYIRKGPGMNYEYYNVRIYNAGQISHLQWDTVIDMSYLPQGRSIKILGHTEFQETHNNLTGYWYYCQTNFSYYEESMPAFVWIFGPSLDTE